MPRVKKTKWAEVFYECSAWVEGRHTSAARKCGGREQVASVEQVAQPCFLKARREGEGVKLFVVCCLKVATCRSYV